MFGVGQRLLDSGTRDWKGGLFSACHLACLAVVDHCLKLECLEQEVLASDTDILGWTQLAEGLSAGLGMVRRT